MINILNIIDDFIQKYGWENFSASNIIAKTSLKKENFCHLFNSKKTFIKFLLNYIQQETAKNMAIEDDLTNAEKIFELTMLCLENAQPYKKIFTSIMPLSLKNFNSTKICNYAKDLPSISPVYFSSMRWLLSNAGYHLDGCVGQVKVYLLSLLFLRIIFVWLNDHSPYMNQTLTEVDKIINQYSIHILDGSLENCFNLI